MLISRRSCEAENLSTVLREQGVDVDTRGVSTGCDLWLVPGNTVMRQYTPEFQYDPTVALTATPSSGNFAMHSGGERLTERLCQHGDRPESPVRYLAVYSLFKIERRLAI